MGSWKQEAERLFFDSKMSIVDIETAIGVSRKSISGHLRSHPDYDRERQDRKAANAEARTEYKRKWDRQHRCTIPMSPTAESIRREHELAVRELSAERYH